MNTTLFNATQTLTPIPTPTPDMGVAIAVLLACVAFLGAILGAFYAPACCGKRSLVRLMCNYGALRAYNACCAPRSWCDRWGRALLRAGTDARASMESALEENDWETTDI